MSKNKAEDELEDCICDMCGTHFHGKGGVCSQECAVAWVNTYMPGPPIQINPKELK